MSIPFSIVEYILDEHKSRNSFFQYDQIYLTRLLQFTSEALLKNINDTYKKDDLDDKLFLVLMMVKLNHPQGVKPSKISKLTGFSRVQITRYIDTLVNKNWVERQDNPKDRRSQHLVLSEQGVEFLQKKLPPVQQKIVEAWQIISQEEQQQLRTILKKLLKHIM